MAQKIWQDSKVTVVLLPSDQQSATVLSLARDWAEVGILGPALWVRPEDITKNAGPPIIKATVIGTPPEQGVIQVEVDLFEQLAREDFKIIRLVKLRSTTEESQSDSIQDEIVKLLDNYLMHAMPAPDRRQNNLESRVRLDIITLVCSTTELKAEEILTKKQIGKGVTIYASPEDRSSPWSTDAFVRNSDRFAGFMLMHLATVGGLWNGLPIGTLELIDSKIPNHNDVSISRVFFSGVLTDGLARRVAAETLDYAARFESVLEDSPVGTAYIEDDKQDFYIETLAQLFIKDEGSELLFKRPEEYEVKAPKKLGAFAQIRKFLIFAGQRFVQIPEWTFRYFKVRFSRRVQKTFQPDSGFADVNPELLRQNLDPQDQLILDLFVKNKETVENAKIDMQAPILQTQVRSTTALWKRIRTLVFGALDGGPGLLDSGFEKVGDEELTPIFQNVKTLFTHPDDKWEFPEQYELPEDLPHEVKWQNATECRDVQKRLREWIGDLRAETKQFNEAVLAKRTEFETDSDLLELTETRLRDCGAFVEDESGSERLLTLANARRIFSVRAKIDDLPEVDSTNSEKEAAEIDLQSDDQVDDGVEILDEESQLDASDDSEMLSSGEQTPDYSEDEDYASQFDHLLDATTLDDLSADIRLRRSLQQRTKNVAKEIAQLELLAQEKARVLMNAESALSEFESQIQLVERTLLWKLDAELQRQRDAAQSEADYLEERINNLVLDEPNQLVKFRKQFHKGLILAWGLILLVGIIAVVFRYASLYEQGLTSNLFTSFYDWWVWFLLLILSAFTLPYLILALFYYRRWERHRRKMSELELELQHLPERYINARKEVQRLEVIHKQTFEWLDLLARALINPWSVRPKWLQSSLTTLNTSAMPFAMRVAHANDEDKASKAILTTKATKKLVTPGWRQNAFNRLVHQIAQVHGRTPDAFSVEALDKDLPHASNGTRKLLRDSLSDVETLENVALTFLRPLISDLQANAMAAAKPTVLQVDDNPLSFLRTDLEGIEDGVKEEKWEDFLLHSLTREDGRPDPITPISALALSEIAVAATSHENVSSFALMSKHVEKRIGGPEGLNNVKVKAYEPERVRPLDAVVRVDIIGPIKAAELRLWGSAKSGEPAMSRAPIESNGQYEEL